MENDKQNEIDKLLEKLERLEKESHNKEIQDIHHSIENLKLHINNIDKKESVEINELKVSLENLRKEIFDISKSLKEEVEIARKDCFDKINAIRTIDGEKMDRFDEALRGNGRIGLFEEVRYNQKQIYVLFTCVVLLFGGKFLGASASEIIKSIFHIESIENSQKTNEVDNKNKLIDNKKDDKKPKT